MQKKNNNIILVILTLILLSLFFFILIFTNKKNYRIEKKPSLSSDIRQEKKMTEAEPELQKNNCPKSEGCEIPNREDIGAIVTGVVEDGIFYQEIMQGGLPVSKEDRKELFLGFNKKTEIVILEEVASGRIEKNRKRSQVDADEGFEGLIDDFKKGDLIHFIKENDQAVLVFLVDDNQLY